jgi:hypothetical protein
MVIWSKFPCLPITRATPQAELPADDWLSVGVGMSGEAIRLDVVSRPESASEAELAAENLAEVGLPEMPDSDIVSEPVESPTPHQSPSTSESLPAPSQSLVEAPGASPDAFPLPADQSEAIPGPPGGLPEAPQRVQVDQAAATADGDDVIARRARKTRNQQRYRARQKMRREASESTTAAADERSCVRCGGMFAPYREKQRYCTPSCQRAAAYAARKDRRKQPVARSRGRPHQTPDPLMQWPPAVRDVQAEVERLEHAVEVETDGERAAVLRRQLLMSTTQLNSAKRTVMAGEYNEEATAPA